MYSSETLPYMYQVVGTMKLSAALCCNSEISKCPLCINKLWQSDITLQFKEVK